MIFERIQTLFSALINNILKLTIIMNGWQQSIMSSSSFMKIEYGYVASRRVQRGNLRDKFSLTISATPFSPTVSATSKIPACWMIYHRIICIKSPNSQKISTCDAKKFRCGAKKFSRASRAKTSIQIWLKHFCNMSNIKRFA